MLSEKLINDLAKYTAGRIEKAEVVIDGETRSVPIIKREVVGDLVKVYVNTTKGKGEITDVRLLDDKGELMVSKPGSRIKNVGYALVSSFYIKFIEEEITDPKAVFEQLRKESEGRTYGE